MSKHSERIAHLVRQASQRRDLEVKGMVADDKGPSEIGRELGVTRQRAQQIIKRIFKRRNGKLA